MIDEELHNKHVFYMTIFGDRLKSTDKEIKLKIKYNNNIYDLSSDTLLLFRKNNRFSSNLLLSVRFTILPTDNTEEIINEPQIEMEPSLEKNTTS